MLAIDVKQLFIFFCPTVNVTFFLELRRLHLQELLFMGSIVLTGKVLKVACQSGYFFEIPIELANLPNFFCQAEK